MAKPRWSLQFGSDCWLDWHWGLQGKGEGLKVHRTQQSTKGTRFAETPEVECTVTWAQGIGIGEQGDGVRMLPNDLTSDSQRPTRF